MEQQMKSECIKTIKHRYFEDGLDKVVSHTYIIEKDEYNRRYTDFYRCGNEKSARRLISILENNK